MSDESILFFLFGAFFMAGLGLIVGGIISIFKTWFYDDGPIGVI